MHPWCLELGKLYSHTSLVVQLGKLYFGGVMVVPRLVWEAAGFPRGGMGLGTRVTCFGGVMVASVK